MLPNVVATMSLSKLKSKKEQMRKDLESQKSASKKHLIETDLLGENNAAYYQNDVENWTLLRKHVYALQCYINDKIPPKHELFETLEEAFE